MDINGPESQYSVSVSVGALATVVEGVVCECCWLLAVCMWHGVCQCVPVSSVVGMVCVIVFLVSVVVQPMVVFTVLVVVAVVVPLPTPGGQTAKLGLLSSPSSRLR